MHLRSVVKLKKRTLDNIFAEKSNQLDRKEAIWDKIESKYVVFNFVIQGNLWMIRTFLFR